MRNKVASSIGVAAGRIAPSPSFIMHEAERTILAATARKPKSFGGAKGPPLPCVRDWQGGMTFRLALCPKA